jgi:hypothetical protein
MMPMDHESPSLLHPPRFSDVVKTRVAEDCGPNMTSGINTAKKPHMCRRMTAPSMKGKLRAREVLNKAATMMIRTNIMVPCHLGLLAHSTSKVYSRLASEVHSLHSSILTALGPIFDISAVYTVALSKNRATALDSRHVQQMVLILQSETICILTRHGEAVFGSKHVLNTFQLFHQSIL